MFHAFHGAGTRVSAGLMVIATACLAVPAFAHVHWTRVNAVDEATVALYHFENVTEQEAPAESPLPAGLALIPSSALQPIAALEDTAGAIFGTHSVRLGTQTLLSTLSAPDLDGDLTIEFWFKWLPTMTSSTVEIGLRSGARIHVSRDVLHPGNDRFGVAGTHGSFVDAPGFTNWIDVGEEEASLNEWRHLGVTIHSAGLEYNTALGHDVYRAGSVARLYLNGHAVGLYPYAIDVAGFQVHDASRIAITMRGDGVAVDEFAVWRKDWSENGSVDNPFSDGRGEQADVAEWSLY